MTALPPALPACGTIITAAVILFNWWQERRINRDTVRRFEGPVEDILLRDDFRLDPATVAAIDDDAVTAHFSNDSKQAAGFDQTTSIANKTSSESVAADAEQTVIETEN